MVTYEQAKQAADHLRAKHVVARSTRPLGRLFVFIWIAAVVARHPTWDSLAWLGGIVLTLIAGPWIVGLIVPKGNLATYRLALMAYPLNGLLLGFVVFMVASDIPPIFIEGVDLNWLYPSLSLLVPLVYYVIQFVDWERHFRIYAEVKQLLAAKPDATALEEVARLRDVALSGRPKAGSRNAEFRSVPATPKNWKMYMKLDKERHGIWRAAFGDIFAVVVFKDGGRLEAVPPRGLRTAADDAGTGPRRCLLRWNDHLHEGLITPENLRKIQEWNGGFSNPGV